MDMQCIPAWAAALHTRSLLTMMSCSGFGFQGPIAFPFLWSHTLFLEKPQLSISDFLLGRKVVMLYTEKWYKKYLRILKLGPVSKWNVFLFNTHSKGRLTLSKNNVCNFLRLSTWWDMTYNWVELCTYSSLASLLFTMWIILADGYYRTCCKQWFGMYLCGGIFTL